MITVKEIAQKTMTAEKRASAKNDLFAFYIGRPISYVLTIPFLYTNITPNTVSLFSIIPIIVGFVLACVAKSKTMMILAWSMFFLWNLLDGGDGNIARYKKQFSRMGSVYDAMAGYLAAAFTFFAAGVMASHSNGFLLSNNYVTSEWLIILGGTTGLFNMFPRLVMHKAITVLGSKETTKEISEKQNFGLIKIIALNLKSCAGGAQVVLLVSIIFGFLDMYTVFYFFFNALIMLGSLRSVFKER